MNVISDTFMKHLDRGEFADLEDHSMSELLALNDKVAELTSTGY